MRLSLNKKKTAKVAEEEVKKDGDTVENSEIKESNSSAGLPAGQAGSAAFSGTVGSDAYRVLRGFYVSEKASMGMTDNQYMFRVFNNANKSEIKKEVAKLFNVKVKSVKVLNMPEKRRDFGKHPGSRSGFKKAIVILEEGFTIGQAKP